MPNKRDADRVLIGAWVHRDLKAKCIKAATELGLTMSDFIEELLKQFLASKTNKPNNSKSENK